MRDVEYIREHYTLTLRQWARRREERQDDARRPGGERMYRLWRIHMGIAPWQFERVEFGVHQTLLAKPTGGPSG